MGAVPPSPWTAMAMAGEQMAVDLFWRKCFGATSNPDAATHCMIHTWDWMHAPAPIEISHARPLPPHCFLPVFSWT